ncbi:hypothetical protein ACRRTK_011229 [Alexandromys fortis]
MGEGEDRGGERPQGRAGEVPVLAEPGRVECWRRATSLIVSWWTDPRYLPTKPGAMPCPCCMVQLDQKPSADLCSASTPRNDTVSQSV